MYLVTGGAGFIGSNLVASLAAQGQDVVVCDQFLATQKWRNVAKAQLADVIHPKDLLPFLNARGRAAHAVLHMGAVSSTTETDVDLIVESNIRLSTDLWDWCAKHRVPLIYASSAATYGDGQNGFDDDGSLEHLAKLRPLNPYGWSKHVFDRTIAKRVERGEPKPPQWVGLKFFNVYGPNEYHKGSMQSVVAKSYPIAAAGQIVRLFRSHRPDFTDGGQLRDFVYVKDCVDVVTWLLNHPEVSGLFNVGTGHARSFANLINALFDAVGQPTTIEYVEMPDEIRDKYQYYTQANTHKLRQAGYDAPFASIEQGVRDYVENHLATDDPYCGPESYSTLPEPNQVATATNSSIRRKAG